MTTLLSGLVAVGLSVVAALIGLLAVHRFVPTRIREDENDVAGFIYAMLGVAYAVLLAFVIIVVWEHFYAAREIVQREANAAASLYELGKQYADPDRKQLQDLVKAYGHKVVDDEWPLMARGGESKLVEGTLDEIADVVGRQAATGNRGLVLYDQSTTQLHELANQRRLRLLASRHSLHPILWIVLLVGGFITIAFTYFFGLARLLPHALMVTAMTVVVAGSLFMIWATDLPFTGDVSVHPEAFEQMLRHVGG